jgi:lipid-A-disaccharide synthase-like uncharacterized protein
MEDSKRGPIDRDNEKRRSPVPLWLWVCSKLGGLCCLFGRLSVAL